MNTLTRPLVLLVAVVLSAGCGPSEPCSGGGMSVDGSPLHSEWQSRGGLPEGAIACKAEGLDPDPAHKSYELGASVDEGFDGTVKHLTVNSWKELSRTPDDRGRNAEFERDGHTLALRCSKSVTDKGWCTLELKLGN